MNIETEREEDGHWIAEVLDLPGVMAYGQSQEEAIAQAEALASRVLADRLEHGEETLKFRSRPSLRAVFPSTCVPASVRSNLQCAGWGLLRQTAPAQPSRRLETRRLTQVKIG
jgi:predicted RNase H-like HicB family nuclease